MRPATTVKFFVADAFVDKFAARSIEKRAESAIYDISSRTGLRNKK
jgi:hypothetical protein